MGSGNSACLERTQVSFANLGHPHLSGRPNLLVGGAEFDRDEIVDAAGGAFVFGDDEAKRAVLIADWFAVHGVGDDDVSGMEAGVGFGE